MLGDVSWGTHFCQFYETREDLLEIFIPYLRAGLENHELCLWVTCEPGDAGMARDELLQAFPGAEPHLRAGDVEIVSCRDWYLNGRGQFDAQRVVAAWRRKVDAALARGYEGVRAHCNEAWLTRKTWHAFAEYERTVDKVMAGLPLIALCTYPLAGTSGAEVFDVAATHRFAVARREGGWEVMETVESVAARAEVERMNAELASAVETRTRELAGTSAALRESEELFRFIMENAQDMVALYDAHGRRAYLSPSYQRVLGHLPDGPLSGSHPDDLPALQQAFARVRAGERTRVIARLALADGSWHWFEADLSLVHYRGQPHVLAATRDITERRRLEEELHQNEALYRLIAENSNDLITLRDLDGHRVYGSPSFLRVLGRPAPETKELAIRHMHPDDQGLARRFWASVVRGDRTSTTATMRQRGPGGAWVWLEEVCERVEYLGRPHVLSVLRDVTGRKEAERAHVWFLESLDRANRAIQGSTDLEQMMSDVLDAILEIFSADQAGLFYPADPDAPAWTVPMFRYRGELSSPVAAGHPVPRTPYRVRMMRKLVEAGGPVQFGEAPGQVPLSPAARDVFGVRSTLGVVVHPRGDRPYVFAIGQGSHGRVWTPEEERLAEEIGRRLADGLTGLTTLRDLRASEARFRIFVDHATDAFFLHDQDGTILDANRQAAASLGYTREELVGMKPADFDAELQPAHYEQIARRLAAGERIAFDTRHRRKDGSVFPVDVRARSFVERGVRLTVSLARDTSERTRLEEEFRQAQKMEAVGRLAGGVAHDFNNLLTAILGYAELVLDDLPEGSPAVADIAEIRMAAERAQGVTRQLLAFSRRQVLQPRVVDLAEVVGAFERMLRLLVREDVAFEVLAEPGPLPVSIDPVQVEQVLMNLVVNARDATPAGGRITVEAGWVRGARRHGAPDRPAGYARLVVRDTGVGMTPEVAVRVFEPFFTTKSSGVGTGLGLSTVFGIVRQSQGYVWVDTAPGEGASFTVLIPITHDPLQEGAEAVAARSRPLAGMRAVVVEDDDGVRHFVAETLRRNRLEVLDFGTPAEALPVLSDPRREVDVLVTDVVLPGMSGPEMVATVQSRRPGLAVIYTSGYTAEEEPYTEALRSAKVLSKPFGADELMESIRGVTDG